MTTFIKHLIKLSVLMAILPAGALAAQAPNPRLSAANASGRTTSDVDSNTSLRRSASNVIARSTANNNQRQQKQGVVSSRATLGRSGVVRSPRSVPGAKVSSAKVSRVATTPTAIKSSASNARSATKPVSTKKSSGLSRVATARATAVFSDISKIGGGYANCRDSYATCMDQFCAGANETYRRCFCSDKFLDFRDTADALDTALKMLAEFQDNNLNAVDKTAAEVSAMYTATAGEAAIKKDTSASYALLASIGDVLSGKKTTTQPKTTNNNSGNSIGVLDLSSFSSGFDDVWGGGSDSLFSDNKKDTMEDMSEKAGKELFTSSNAQCSEITRDACNSDAMFNLARSAYTVMITQDCNMYEKNLNAKKQTVEETVRTAEKYLREARLEEYRSHNSADVNECLTKVEEAMKQPLACGSSFEKCMDPTGLYINSSTGEPIYSQALFGLNNLIILDGTADVLGANKDFDKTLESKKMFANTALDSCRDLADTVWYEFKRSAIIQIAQAQDAKIQSVKDSCVVTIKECYDKQTGDLKSLDDTESQSTGAIATMAARGMCYERVQACAALYGDPDGCKYDDKSKKLTQVSGKKCGLQALLSFVDTVDSVKIAEGCESALKKYAKELCPDKTIPATSDEEEAIVIPYGTCALPDKNEDGTMKPDTVKRDEIRAAMELYIDTFCPSDLMNDDQSRTIGNGKAYNMNLMNQLIKDMFDAMNIVFTSGCTSDNLGQWYNADGTEPATPDLLRQDFYEKFYGVTIRTVEDMQKMNFAAKGYCLDNSKVENDKKLEEACDIFGGTKKGGVCELKDNFYKVRCCQMGGTYDATSGNCTIDNWPNVSSTNCGSLF